ANAPSSGSDTCNGDDEVDYWSCEATDGAENDHCTIATASCDDDGDPCTVDVCSAGACSSVLQDDDDDGHAPETCGGDDCDDSDPFSFPGAEETCDGNDNDCDESIDEEPEASQSCNDGLWCNGEETCDEGLGCQAGTEVGCDDGIPCTEDYCDEDSDQCDEIDNCAEISVYLDCPTNAMPEDPVTISVEISDAGGIDAVGFDLSFDAGIFAYTGFGTTGCLLDGWVEFDCVEDSGVVSCDGISGTPLPNGSNGCLVEFDFNVLPGTAGFSTELSIDALLEDLSLMSTTPCSIYIGECTEDWECEDGLFCNGADTCLDGTCTHSGNPCDPVTQSCNEDLDICEDLECELGHLCVTAYLNGHWAGSGYRPDVIDIELHSGMDSPAATYSGIPLDEDCVASVELTGIEDGLYEVVARHLNHIDLATDGMVFLSMAESNTVDLSNPDSVACGESALIWEASNGGKWTMPGGDASGDGSVNIFDYFSMGQQWGGTGPESDYTGDGAVNIFDYFILGQNWGRGECPDVP
ncbi:hypothetical protein ACFL4G_12490, partial [Thermodesulfobacteriota bacterium]